MKFMNFMNHLLSSFPIVVYINYIRFKERKIVKRSVLYKEHLYGLFVTHVKLSFVAGLTFSNHRTSYSRPTVAQQ